MSCAALGLSSFAILENSFRRRAKVKVTVRRATEWELAHDELTRMMQPSNRYGEAIDDDDRDLLGVYITATNVGRGVAREMEVHFTKYSLYSGDYVRVTPVAMADMPRRETVSGFALVDEFNEDRVLTATWLDDNGRKTEKFPQKAKDLLSWFVEQRADKEKRAAKALAQKADEPF